MGRKRATLEVMENLACEDYNNQLNGAHRLFIWQILDTFMCRKKYVTPHDIAGMTVDNMFNILIKEGWQFDEKKIAFTKQGGRGE